MVAAGALAQSWPKWLAAALIVAFLVLLIALSEVGEPEPISSTEPCLEHDGLVQLLATPQGMAVCGDGTIEDIEP